MEAPGVTVREDKKRWRLHLRAGRRAQSRELRTARGSALIRAVVQIADEHAAGRPVCAYMPVGTEPAWAEGLDALRAAGHEVLLPIVPVLPGPLDWARYDGPDTLGPGPIGLREPTGPRLGVEAVARARLVLVPGLAVDRSGVRLGQGAGYYDMTLSLAAPDAFLVVVLNDEELVESLPGEPHDHRVHAALLADAGLVALG
ncbi:MAG: 5-formyltetrahydrofolate cyclo-ligase [Pseudonocardia sp.]